MCKRENEGNEQQRELEVVFAQLVAIDRARNSAEVDLAVNTGTPVLAFAAGTVDYIGDSPIYGLYLQLDHGNGLKTFYAHCSKLCVQQGQQIALGEKVAESGNTGNSTGPHLHFEMKLNGVLLNPLYYIETT